MHIQSNAEEAQAIIESCVRYGFCTNTCPTYVLTRDENESPRGRIALIRSMLESNQPPKPATVAHLDTCLSCLSCMTTCAAKVEYHHLIDHARAHVERNYRRSLRDRLIRSLLVALLPHPSRFYLALRVSGLGQLVQRLDPRLRAMLKMRPKRLPAHPDLRRGRQVYPAQGERRHRVILITGCVQRVIADYLNKAAIRLLCRHGAEVIVLPSVECCGALTLHLGHPHRARASAVEMVRAIEREHRAGPVDAVVITASGCGTTVKDYPHLLADYDDVREAAALTGGLTRDITEFLADLPLRPAGSTTRGVTVAYHDACSLQHGQKITKQPRALLEQAGFIVRNVPESHLCCGSAGTYNLLQPATAESLGRRKASHIASTGAQVISAGNLGCMTQIGLYASNPVVHTIELLDWATGGPIPPALENVVLERMTLDRQADELPQQDESETHRDTPFW